MGTLRKTIELLKGDLKSVSAIHLLAIDEMIESEKPSGEIILPDNIRFNKGYKLFCISDKSTFNENYIYEIKDKGVYRLEKRIKSQCRDNI